MGGTNSKKGCFKKIGKLAETLKQRPQWKIHKKLRYLLKMEENKNGSLKQRKGGKIR